MTRSENQIGYEYKNYGWVFVFPYIMYIIVGRSLATNYARIEPINSNINNFALYNVLCIMSCRTPMYSQLSNQKVDIYGVQE